MSAAQVPSSRQPAPSQRLADATLALVDIPSESWNERAALDHCAARLAGAGVPLRWDATRDVLFAGHLAGASSVPGRPLVLLAGHLDTVPAQGNIPGRIEDGRVWGLGATDMKGACAVIVELLCDLWADEHALQYSPGAVLFAREELPFGDSALTPALAAEVALDDAEIGGGVRATDATAAIVMEPTSGRVQAGCLGNVNATWHFEGVSAHSARPWQGVNALDAVGEALTTLAGVEAIEHTYSGLTYTECITATGVRGGVARNVVPGAAEIDVNYRYPPGMAPGEAERKLRALTAGAGHLELVGHAPSGAVTVGSEPVRSLIALTGEEPEPKQAWTPVAELTLAGVDAVNFGPGDPPLAHQVGEYVRIEALAHAYATLDALFHGEGGSGE